MGAGGIPFFKMFLTELRETGNRQTVARGWDMGKMGDSGQKVQISSYEREE